MYSKVTEWVVYAHIKRIEGGGMQVLLLDNHSSEELKRTVGYCCCFAVCTTFRSYKG